MHETVQSEKFAVDEIKFAWVCRNVHFNEISIVELSDVMLLKRDFPSWIISDNCELLAKIRPTGKFDCTGEMIWEGDLLRSPNGIIYPVAWDSGAGEWKAINDEHEYRARLWPESWCKSKRIGNRFTEPGIQG